MKRVGLRELGIEVAAGAMTAAVALPLCIAAGVLTFSVLGGSHAAMGSVAGIVSAIAGGSVAALLRRSSFVSTIPTNPNALIQASVLAGLLATYRGDAHEAILALTACVALAGLLQAALGATGLARIVKLAPHPVIAGFVSGVGILIMKSQLPMLLDVPSLGALVAGGPGAGAFTRLPFALALIAVILTSSRRLPKVPPMLAGLLAGLAAFHVLRLAVPHLDLGPVVGPISLGAWEPADIRAVAAVLWRSDATLWWIVLGGGITLALVGTLDTVFTLRAARNMADIAVDQSRDLVGQGIASVAAAMTGGLFVSTSMSLTATNYQAGGRSRISTLAAAFLLLAGLALFPGFLAALPLVVLSAILVVVGINVVDRWALRIGRQALLARDVRARAHARRNGAIVLAVSVATFLGQPIVGAGVGVALACVVFMIEMTRPIVRHRDTAGVLRSKRIRSVAQNAILAVKGAERVVLELDGVLFFGNADRLATEIEEHHDGARIVVLDLRHVTNVDASGAATLEQIAGRLAKAGRQLVLCGVRELDLLRDGRPALAAAPCFANLDAALEKAEDEIVARSQGGEATGAELTLHETDFGRTMTAGDLAILGEHMERREFARGTVLARAGDPGDRLWVLVRGSIGIWLEAPEGRHRLASIGTGCVVGEMGLLNGLSRSADICADEDVAAYELTAAGFANLLERKPRIGQALLTGVARQLAERLRMTSEELRAATL